MIRDDDERARAALETAIMNGMCHASGRHSPPGTIIKRLPEHIREDLKKLTSDAARNMRGFDATPDPRRNRL